MDCIFCKIIAGQIPSTKILETQELIVIKDINPKAPIHYLIIPKEHIADMRELTEKTRALGTHIFTAAQKLSKDLNNAPFRLVISNGPDAGQRVYHLHVHFLAGATFVE